MAKSVPNGNVSAQKQAALTRDISVYSEVQLSRLDHQLPLPSVLEAPFKLVSGPPTTAAGSPEEIAKLFPQLYGQPSVQLVPSDTAALKSDRKLNRPEIEHRCRAFWWPSSRWSQ